MNKEQLVSIVERIERLEEDAAQVAVDIKEIYSEAKSAGYDPKYIKKIIALRKELTMSQIIEDEVSKFVKENSEYL